VRERENNEQKGQKPFFKCFLIEESFFVANWNSVIYIPTYVPIYHIAVAGLSAVDCLSIHSSLKYTHTHSHTHILTHTNTHTNYFFLSLTHTYTKYIHSHTLTHTHTHTHTQTHTNTHSANGNFSPSQCSSNQRAQSRIGAR